MKNKKKLIIPIISILFLIIIFAIFILSKKKVDYETYVNNENNISNYFEFSYNKVDKNVINYTGNINVDSFIEKVIKDNNYHSTELLQEWHDSAIDTDNYFILFNNEFLYCFVYDGTTVYANQQDYEYYLESQ